MRMGEEELGFGMRVDKFDEAFRGLVLGKD